MEKINFIELFILTVWLMLPVWLANMSPAIAGSAFKNFSPLDFGKSIGSQRILGDGKTFEGLLTGIVIGAIIATIELYFSKQLNMPSYSLIAIITMPAGALFGDLIASFLKRRLDIKRGSALPIIDQLDFVIGAWLLTIIFDYNWYVNHFTIPVIMFTLVITGIFHFIFNVIGYKIGVCNEPW